MTFVQMLKCRENVTIRRKADQKGNQIITVQGEGTKEAKQRHHGAKATKQRKLMSTVVK